MNSNENLKEALMDKLEVQKRVLHHGKPLALSEFTWCEKTKTFASATDHLVIDFKDVHEVTFNVTSYCTFETGHGCVFKAEKHCSFTAGTCCTFKTLSNCSFYTGEYCTFDTGYSCAFVTWGSCTFNTWAKCTFKTLSDCVFHIDSECTIDAGSDCVIVQRHGIEGITPKEVITPKEAITPKKGEVIQTFPCGIKGHLINGELDGVPHIIADGILSRIVKRIGNVYQVVNHGETRKSFLVKQGDVYSHGDTLKEARDGLVYKLSDRDVSVFKDLSLDSVVTHVEAIQMYRVITGACEGGTRSFVESNSDKTKEKYTIQELIDLTSRQYGADAFRKFFIK